MSDQSQGPGWWQASDGRWYPPHLAPGVHSQLPPPQPQLPTAPHDAGSSASSFSQTPPTKKKRHGCLIGLAVTVVAFIVLGVIAAVVGSGEDDEPSSGRDRPSSNASTDTTNDDGETTDGDQASAAAGSGDEVDDVAPCTLLDSSTVVLDLTNNSSKMSSYVIDVNFLDASGTRVGDEPFFVNHVRPGERVLEESFALDTAGGTDCEIAEVDRFESESPDDVTEATCEVTGEDLLGDITTSLTATNGSSKLSDYLIFAALTREGVRIGDVNAVIENVQPGSSAPSDGFTTADGPATGVTCEVVHVERMASE